MTTAVRERTTRDFWLVQRLSLSPYKRHAEAFPKAKVKSNPFGYGRMGDYELDYMGAAEFEFGEIPKANNRLAEAGKDLVLTEFEHKGHTFDLLYIGAEGDPVPTWKEWAKGKPPFDGKERPYELEQRLNGKEPWSKERGWQTAIWWALGANVLWAFKEDGHLHRWIESMGSAPTEFLR